MSQSSFIGMDAQQGQCGVVVSHAWKEGFKAGKALRKNCPYSMETPEGSSWFDGWNEGASKTLGFPYRTYTKKFRKVAPAS